MKMLIKKMGTLLVITACLQLSGYAATNHDNMVKMGRGIKPVLPFTYYLTTTWEGGYIDNTLYIEYKSFTVHYSAPLPYNVTISYNLYYEDAYGSSNTEYFATGVQGTTSTYLGYYETFHQDSNNPNNSFSLDLILNYVQ